MPAYPCEDCGNLVDTNGNGQCKKCNTKKPFKCSKCGRRLGVLGIYQVEKIKFRKPLFCTECGPEVEQVPCSQCGVSLSRSTGVEVTINGVDKVFHKDCYDKQIRMYRKVLPAAVICMYIICGYFGYMIHHAWWMVILFGFIGLPIGKSIAKPFAPK